MDFDAEVNDVGAESQWLDTYDNSVENVVNMEDNDFLADVNSVETKVNDVNVAVKHFDAEVKIYFVIITMVMVIIVKVFTNSDTCI